MDEVQAAAVVRVLGNRTRIGFMRSLQGRPALSPVEYSRLSGEDLREVARHVRALAGAGLIAVVDVVPRRGAFEHRYAVGGERGEAALAIIELLAGV
jgi:DNA-binding transcriptional ArsR family regulator